MALPEIALVSPAARTTATAEIVLDAAAPAAGLQFPTDLYGADPTDVLIRLSKLGDDVSVRHGGRAQPDDAGTGGRDCSPR